MHPSRGRKKKQASFFDLPAISALNKKRGTRKFSCESRDGIEMKIYLGTGCVPSHFNVKDFCEKYPQFDVYERTSLASAFNRLKRSANKTAFDQGKEKVSKYLFIHIYFYFYINYEIKMIILSYVFF